jgi:hypothetical protein
VQFLENKKRFHTAWTQSGPQPPTPVCILAVWNPGRAAWAALFVSRDVLTKAQMSACGG